MAAPIDDLRFTALLVATQHTAPSTTTAAPPCASFRHIANAQLRHDKELLQHLHLLAARYQHRADLISDWIEELEDAAEPPPTSERERVLAALADGYRTVKEIRRCARLTQWKTRRLLDQLIQLGWAERFTPDKTLTHAARGGTTLKHYRLRHTPALPPGVLP